MMSKKGKTEEPIYDFSDDWEEIQPVIWQWIMWDNEGEEVTGWIVEVRQEEFTDKQTGEVRTNLVCYMVKENGECVRFIVPTDLRIKLTALDEKRAKAKREWKDLMLKIVYKGKVDTSKGYKVKTFKVLAKKAEMPKELTDNIPELPTLDIEGLDEIADDF
jgi:hypothetical protein